MRPVPIPDELVPDGCIRKVIGPPDGDLTSTEIGAVEVVCGVDDEMGFTQAVLMVLEPGDMERLEQCGGVWLTFRTTQLPIFSLEIADGGGN